MAMSTPDMEVIKEIPGYKVILKAVLKSQIQQLVEQLAKTTDEESVILTASVADGTLCHLGSDSGKIFLEDHEDIKSQFLGFCLKRHHAEKLEEERKAAQEREDALSRSMQSEPSPHFISIPPFNPTQYQPPRRNSPRIRSPSNRHQPYPIRGPIPVQQPIKSNTVPGPVSSTRTSTEGPVIKTEPFSDNDNSNSQAGGVSNSNISSEPASTFNSTISSPDSKRENCLSSTVDPSVLDNSINIGLDPNVSVKLESGTNDEELEITGVELGQGPPVSKQDWTLNLQAGGPGATGTSAEMNPDQQGFITIDMLQEITKDNINDELDTEKLPLVLPYSVDEMLEKSMIRGKPTSAQIYFRKLLRDAAISANIWKTAPMLSEISDSKRIAFFNAFEMIPGLNERKKDIWKRLGESLQNRRKYLNDKTKGKRLSRDESSDY